MPAKSQGQLLTEKADKKANSSGGWFSSSTSKWEEAGDLYQQAANAYKIDKLFKEAGDSFAREAECRENGKEANEAANAWWNAAKAYKQGNPDLAIQAFARTVTHLTQAGRFRQAADREKDIGRIYLDELGDLRKACESFERAGDWYSQESSEATASQLYKESADLHGELDEYPQAIALYERISETSLKSPLGKHSVKDYYQRAALCALAMGDPIAARRNIGKYKQREPNFATTRECKFVDVLVDAVDSGDLEAFTGAVVEYDQVAKLDNWKTAILLKIKRGINEEPDLT